MKRQINNSYTRNSGVELLRIIAIFVICMSHCVQNVQSFYDFTLPSNDITALIMKLLYFGGIIGNITFIVCSSYFLIDSKKAKKEKAINILMDSQFISIIIFVAYLFYSAFVLKRINISLGKVANNFFPDLFEMVWFVPAYVIFYLLHPAFNKIIYSTSQRKHFIIVFCIFIFYGLFGLINVMPCFSALLGFAFIYFIVAYMKLYCHNWQKNVHGNFICLCLCFVLLVLITALKNYLGLKYDFFVKYPEINSLISVVLLPMVLSAFNIFNSFNFKSKTVNYLSSCTLFFFCIHANSIVRTKVPQKVYGILINNLGSNNFLIYALIFTVILFVFSYIVSIVYKETFHKLTVKLSMAVKIKTVEFADRVYRKVSEKLN